MRTLRSLLLLITAFGCAAPAPPPPTVMTGCDLPTERTTIREQDGAVLETWALRLEDVLVDALPGESAFLEYRTAIERDSADLRRPVRDPPRPASEEAAAMWQDEFYNNDLVFNEGVGAVEPISCLDALLFARQAGRYSQLDRPTEFSASVLRRERETHTDLMVVFGAGRSTLVPRDYYGFDVVSDLMTEGWDLWYAIHNHTIKSHRGRLALGMPVPSTNDVQLLRSLSESLGLDSVRVTNGFYTFRASVDELSGMRAP